MAGTIPFVTNMPAASGSTGRNDTACFVELLLALETLKNAVTLHNMTFTNCARLLRSFTPTLTDVLTST